MKGKAVSMYNKMGKWAYDNWASMPEAFKAEFAEAYNEYKAEKEAKKENKIIKIRAYIKAGKSIKFKSEDGEIITAKVENIPTDKDGKETNYRKIKVKLYGKYEIKIDVSDVIFDEEMEAGVA